MIIVIKNKKFEVSELYQPLFETNVTVKPMRICIDRLETILQAEEGYNNNEMFLNDFADWGSSLGYFSFNLSTKTKSKVYAVDNDIKNINICKEIQSINNIENIDFINGIAPDDIPDDIKGHIILSVLHHSQKDAFIPDNVLLKLKNSNIIYLELAHCNEWPSWASKLYLEDGHFFSPFHSLKKMLEKQFQDYTVRLIGIHTTHLGSVRPLFQIKKHICESILYNSVEYKIYDKFKIPYIDFGDFSLNSKGELDHKCRSKENIRYAFAYDNSKNKYFLKFKDNKVFKISKFIDGFLLSDLIKFGLLPYYDRKKIKIQLTTYSSDNHNDPYPWNFFILNDSTIIPIDYDEEVASFDKNNVNFYMKMLIQSI